MNKVMKRALGALIALMLPVMAMAEDLALSAPVLLVEIPENMELTTDAQFDDGDFIQGYESADGVLVDLSRSSYGLPEAKEVAMGDWGAAEADIQALAIESVGGYPVTGVRTTVSTKAGGEMDVTIVVVDFGAQQMLFQASFPKALGQETINAQLETMLNSLDVLTPQDAAAEVG